MLGAIPACELDVAGDCHVALEEARKPTTLPENSRLIFTDTCNRVAAIREAENTSLSRGLRRSDDSVAVSADAVYRVARRAIGLDTNLGAREDRSKGLSLTKNPHPIVTDSGDGVAVRSEAEDASLALCLRKSDNRITLGADTIDCVASRYLLA